jgi:hypothetical protein
MSGIPTDTAFTTVNTKSPTTLPPVDLSTSGGVNITINVIADQMLDQGWTQVPLYASVTMTLDLPLVATDVVTNLALWVTDFMGFVFRVYNITLGQRDPTGDLEAGGKHTIGIGAVSQGTMTDTQYQTYLILLLVAAMNANQSPFKLWDVSPIDVGGTFATYQQLLVVATLGQGGPGLNDFFMSANVNGAGLFNGLPKGGGWLYTSVPNPTDGGSTMSVSLTNSFISNLVVAWNFNVGVGEGRTLSTFYHSPHVYYLNFKSNYYSVVTPYDWKLFATNDGVPYTPHSVDELAFGGDNLWICNPRIPADQYFDPVTPLAYCGFSVTKNRSLPYESLNCATCINATFFEGPMDAFEVDVGVSLLVLNAMQRAAGELATTAGKSITISSLIALSSAFDGPLQIVGDCWNMYITTQFAALDKLSMTTDNAHEMIAYRSQTTPCEMTLWLAIS